MIVYVLPLLKLFGHFLSQESLFSHFTPTLVLPSSFPYSSLEASCVVILINSVPERGSRIWPNLYFEKLPTGRLALKNEIHSIEQHVVFRPISDSSFLPPHPTTCTIWSRPALRLDGILATLTLGGGSSSSSLSVP